MPWKGCVLVSAVVALTACGSRTGLADLFGAASEDAGSLDGGAPDIPPSVDSGPTACEPATEAVTLASRPLGTWFASLAVDAANVYWLEHGDDLASPGRLLRVSKCGGPVVTIASTPNYPAGLAIDATNIYWSNQSTDLTGSVLRVPLGGGATSTIAFGGNEATLVIDDTYVYWTDLDDYVLRTAKTGGPTVTLASMPSPWGALAVNTTLVVWTSAGPTTTTLAALPLTGGGAPTILAAALGEPGDLAVDESNAYWAAYNPGYGASAAIVRIPFGGGATTTLASGYPRALAIDDTSIYWTDYPNMTGAGAVIRVPKAGGPAVTIQSGLMAPQQLAIDATSVYWIDDPNVKMAPK